MSESSQRRPQCPACGHTLPASHSCVSGRCRRCRFRHGALIPWHLVRPQTGKGPDAAKYEAEVDRHVTAADYAAPYTDPAVAERRRRTRRLARSRALTRARQRAATWVRRERPLRRPQASRRVRPARRRSTTRQRASGSDPPPDPPPRSSGGLREPAPQHGPRARRLERPRWWVASRAARHQRHAPVGVCALPARLGYGHLDQRDLDVDCPVGWGAAG